MRQILMLACVALLVACESNTSVMKSWVGTTDAHLVSQWGAPDLETKADGGLRVLTYQGRNGYGQIVCRRSFTVDDQHRIIAVSHNCPF